MKQGLALLLGVILGTTFITSTVSSVTFDGFSGSNVISYYIGWRIHTAEILILPIIFYLLIIKPKISDFKQINIIIFFGLYFSILISIFFSQNSSNSILHITRFLLYMYFGMYIVKLINIKWVAWGLFSFTHFAIIWGTLEFNIHNTLLNGPLGNPAIMAGLIIVSSVFLYEVYNKNYLLLTYISFVGLTGSRTGILTALIILTIAAIIDFKEYKGKTVKKYLADILLLSCLTFIAITQTTTGPNRFDVVADFIQQERTLEQFSSHRSEDIKDSWKVIKENFPLGVGFHNIGLTQENIPHNIPIILLTELGILAVIFLMLYLVLLLLSRSLLLLAMGLIGLGDYYLYQGTWAVFVFTSIIIGIHIGQLNEESVKRLLATWKRSTNINFYFNKL